MMAFNPSIPEAEASKSLSSRLVRFIKQVQDSRQVIVRLSQFGLNSETQFLVVGSFFKDRVSLSSQASLEFTM